jgi:C1A family cysteine protease
MHIKNILLIFVPLVSLVNGLINYQTVFDTHCDKFECFYDTNNETDRNHRLGIFKENLDFINEHNSKESNFKLGLNQFSTLTNDEYRKKLNLMVPSKSYKYNAYLSIGNFLSLNLNSKNFLSDDFECQEMPEITSVNTESFNWVSLNKVTSVKNQLECGSCWAFSTIGAYENWYAINNNELVDFSEQELVDCDKSDNGCNGGLMSNGLHYIAENGICDLKTYEYNGVDGRCSRNNCEKRYPKLNGCYMVPENNNRLLETAVLKNTVTIAIEADTVYFQHYSSGVLDNSAKCGTNLDHGVLLVGYGVENGHNYWLVKNSWGESWGEKGYVKLLKSDSDNDSGVCGVAMMGVYPW